jgi:predicted DNA-binding transcriptional regulator AlpA
MKFISLYDIEIPIEFRVVSVEAVCSYLSISKRMVLQSIKNGDIPPPLMVKGKAIGWSCFIIRHWMSIHNINH